MALKYRYIYNISGTNGERTCRWCQSAHIALEHIINKYMKKNDVSRHREFGNVLASNMCHPSILTSTYNIYRHIRIHKIELFWLNEMIIKFEKFRFGSTTRDKEWIWNDMFRIFFYSFGVMSFSLSLPWCAFFVVSYAVHAAFYVAIDRQSRSQTDNNTEKKWEKDWVICVEWKAY